MKTFWKWPCFGFGKLWKSYGIGISLFYGNPDHVLPVTYVYILLSSQSSVIVMKNKLILLMNPIVGRKYRLIQYAKDDYKEHKKYLLNVILPKLT